MSKFNKILNILSLVVIIVQILVITFYIHKLPNYVIYLDFCCLIVYCLITCSNLKLCKKLNLFKNKIISLGKYNSSLIRANEDIRAFKHDFNNIMQAVGGYIKLNDFEGLKEYYNDLIAECNLLKTVTTITPTTVNDCRMYNIIMEKSEVAKKMNITFEFISNIDFCSLENLNSNIEEIIKLFLDTAIKVSKNASKKNIILDCLYDFSKNKYVVVVTNFCDNLNEQRFFNVESLMNNKRYKSIMKSVEKNKSLNLYIELKENILIQELDIDLKELIAKKEHNEVLMMK